MRKELTEMDPNKAFLPIGQSIMQTLLFTLEAEEVEGVVRWVRLRLILCIVDS